MKTNRESIHDLEQKFAPQNLKLKEIQIWLAIKNQLFAFFSGTTLDIKKITFKQKTQFLFSSFKGFHQWLIPRKIWIISSSNIRKQVNGKMYHTLMDYVSEKSPNSRFIELPMYEHFPSSKVISKNLCSKSFLIFLEILISKLLRFGNEELNQIDTELKKNHINTGYLHASKKMIAQYKLMKILLKINKPKIVFLSTSYTNYGYIKAFKEKNIIVVELQHGVISEVNYGYNLFQPFERDYFPDYLLTFGMREAAVFNPPNQWGIGTKIVPIGHFFIDYCVDNFTPNTELVSQTRQFQRLACVSLQDAEIGLACINTIIQAAKLNEQIGYLLVPRRTTEADYRKQFEFPSNIIFVNNLNVYECIMHSHYHISAYSTCALEAPSLGVKNILVNIQNKAVECFQSSLHPLDTTYVLTAQELENAINQEITCSKEDIRKRNSEVIVPGYKKNIDKFLKELC